MRWLLTAVVSGTLTLACPTADAFVWPNTSERVARQLKDPDVNTRRRAAQRLVDLPRGVAKRLAAVALKDSDVEVRLAGAETARRVRLEGLGRTMSTWLNDPESRVRRVAAETLRTNPEPRAVPLLGRVLSDPNPKVREAAARALGASRSPQGAMSLLGHLDDATPSVREAVVEALAQIRDPRSVVPLIGKIQDSRSQVRRAVARALGKLGDARASSALLLALRDADRQVQIAALEALGRLKAKDAVPAIVSLLEGESSAVERAAVSALVEIGGEQAIDVLMKRLETGGSLYVAPGKLGEAAVKRLRECLRGQPTQRLAAGCARAVGQLKLPDGAKLVESAMRRGVLSPGVGLSVLGQLKQDASLAVVLEYLFDATDSVRGSAALAAWQLLDPNKPDGRAVGPLTRAIEAAKASRDERAQLIRLLGRTGSARAVKVIAPFVAAKDDVILRVAAVEALGSLGSVGQDKYLLKALGDEKPSVRYAAALALSRSASPGSVKGLLKRLKSSAEQDRRAVLMALGGAFAGSKSSTGVASVGRMLRSAQGAERDALIEALGRSKSPRAAQELVRLANGSGTIADRSKIAEALANHPKQVAALRRLSGDVHSSVRANAVWSLGAVGTTADTKRLTKLIRDRDVAVAGNAAAALGRLSKRVGADPVSALCAALDDNRGYVRAQALAGLEVNAKRCPDTRERTLLRDDPSEATRAAAASLLVNVPGSGKAKSADEEALDECRASEPSGAVAAECERTKPDDADPDAGKTDSTLVYVIPSGKTKPVSRAPFALVLGDGLMRLGLADRRGAVFEVAAPRGYLRLAVPAPLAR